MRRESCLEDSAITISRYHEKGYAVSLTCGTTFLE